MENKNRYFEIGFIYECGAKEALDVMVVFDDDFRTLDEIKNDIKSEELCVIRELVDPYEIIEALTESHIDLTNRLGELLE